ncbi:hypothetical protein MMC20_006166 [Loxospora ochrophaea]|nr:hypothetical protein [Loxospora ochrophaea]
MPDGLVPLSFASTVIGFASFAFTVLTLVRVSWEALQSIWSAPKQVREYMDNLRQELEEIREDLKQTRKRRHRDARNGSKRARYMMAQGTLRVLEDTVKQLQRDYKRLEEPFLKDLGDGSDVEKESHYTSPLEYKNMDLKHRWIWLRTKGSIISIADQTERIQVRRIACEATNALA